MKNLIILISIAMFFLSSCSTENPIVNNAPTQEITINIKAKLNGKDIAPNSYYLMANGDSISISRLDYYIQNPVFKYRSEKSAKLSEIVLVSFDPAPGVVSRESKIFFKGSNLPLSVDSIRMLIGLDSLTNTSNPTKFESEHPLSSWRNMYWGDWAKYRYIVFEGTIKTVSNGSMTYSYHTGLADRMEVVLPLNLTLNTSNPKQYSLILNIEKIFNPVSGTAVLYNSGELNVHGEPTEAALTKKITNNFSKSFSFE